MNTGKLPEDAEFAKTLRTLAPGTPLREGLENVLRARTGALVVVGDSPQVMELLDGGFRLDLDFLPARLYELAKMDGAIILSHDAQRILYANVQLLPDSSIPSFETGIRHRTAERVAKQTGELVVAISQRRSVITFYKGTTRYSLKDLGVILTKANQAVQTLEKYKAVLDQALNNLTALEFEDLVTVLDVVLVVQRMETVRRIVQEIERYIAELGAEGRLVSMQLTELTDDLEDEGLLVLRDYGSDGSEERAREMIEHLAAWSSEDLLDTAALSRLMGLGGMVNVLDNSAIPRGYRILAKIPRLPMPVIENLVAILGNLEHILDASIEELDRVEGIGEVRARAIRDGLKRLREQALLGRQI
ncbi:MAG: DNA integrity scanning diadenylate cyclase DisA [Thermaerobacter sp.]|nr:DNA integrity scanning diadenylate cyclase DisA [Thermaerobacter sp.]